jgi:hypothetical protein
MARLAKYFAVMVMAVMFSGMIPQANAQVVVRIGHRHHRRHHHYYRHHRR